MRAIPYEERYCAVKKFIKGFKAFAFKGNVLDLAVGVMIGGAFGKIVTSLVNDMFMPLLSLVIGQINLAGAFFPLDGKEYASVDAATSAGVAVFNYGAFLTAVIDFLCTALIIYLFLQAITRMLPKKEEAPPKPEPKRCPYCMGEIDEKATRCPHCTTVYEGFPKALAPQELSPHGEAALQEGNGQSNL